MVLARTKKGRGVKAVEDQSGNPEGVLEPRRIEVPGGEPPRWEPGEEVATAAPMGRR